MQQTDTDLCDRIEGRREPAVWAEELLVDGSCERQKIEQVRETFPHVGTAVLAHTLVVEPIHLRDLPRLMVPAQDGDPEANRPKPLASFVRTRGGEA